ncbi:MAG TPA: hypothetical protein VHO73_02105 [Methylomirabilota bacterium]|jgi:hypothetical protein|nr:hypothetical protein [Methylomirabilota bacterium]
MSGDGSSLGGRVAGAIAWRVFVSTAYTTGLTLLIPFVALRVQPTDLQLVPVGTSPVLMWVAIGLMTAALVVRLWVTRSLSGSLKALGFLTFLPGFVGILASIFGREWLLNRLAGTVPRFQEVRPAIELYLDRAVPQVIYLTVGFFVAGALLLLLGSWLTPREPSAR